MKFKDSKQIPPQKGAFIISDPFLPDDNFKRTVILLCEHNEEGSFGLVINKPIGLQVHEVIEEFPEIDAELFLGGPVENNTLHFLHTIGSAIEDSLEVEDGLYWGGNYDQVRDMIADEIIVPDQIKFFLGYSGWGAGQLESELDEKSWIVSKARKNHIFFDNTDDIWRNVLKEMGGQYFIMSNFPESPLLN